MSEPEISFHEMSRRWRAPLAEFFAALRAVGDETKFHPHALTDAAADERAHYHGRDLFILGAEDGQVVAYGMLRGWDEGFDVPSLGIAVHPGCRGRGIGTRMMQYLHAAARQRGARRIRLKVQQDNPAQQLYRRLGYRFEDIEGGQLVGYLEL